MIAVAAAAAVIYLGGVWVGREGWPKVLPALILAMTVDAPLVRLAMLLYAVGDAFLLRKDRWFTQGLAAFLLGHLAFVAAIRPAPTLGGAAVVAGVAAVSLLFRSHLPPKLRVPVVAYAATLGALLVAAASVSALAGAGAATFIASDALLAWNRFRAPIPRASFLVLATYYAALLLLVAGLP